MIIYPVDVKSTRWAMWQISTGTILAHGRKWPRADGSAIEGLSDDLIPLLMVESAKPGYDLSTQKLVSESPAVDIDENTLTTQWSVVDLSQDELDAVADREAETAERDLVKSLYLALKNSDGTSAERLTRVERVLAHLLKREYGA